MSSWSRLTSRFRGQAHCRHSQESRLAFRGKPEARSSDDRLRAAWVVFLAQVHMEVFVTLTFAPKRYSSEANPRRAAREASRWCEQVQQMCARQIGWVFTIEQRGEGRAHVHSLIVGAEHVDWAV